MQWQTDDDVLSMRPFYLSLWFDKLKFNKRCDALNGLQLAILPANAGFS